MNTSTNWKIFFIIFFCSLCLVLLGAPNDETDFKKIPNTITFDNQSGKQALVKVVGPTSRSIAVPDGETRTVNVTSGEYYILIRYGSEPEDYQYRKGDPFRVVQTSTKYTAITITLHKVIGGDYETHPVSRKEFEYAIINNPKNARLYIYRGVAHLLNNDNDKALYDLTKSIGLDPDFWQAYYHRGLAYKIKKDFVRAITNYSKAIEKNPDYMMSYISRGLCYRNIENYDQAVADFTKAIDLKPNDSSAYYHRGMTYALDNQLDQAVFDFQKALEIQPDFEDAEKNLEKFLQRRKRIQSSLTKLRLTITSDVQWSDCRITPVDVKVLDKITDPRQIHSYKPYSSNKLVVVKLKGMMDNTINLSINDLLAYYIHEGKKYDQRPEGIARVLEHEYLPWGDLIFWESPIWNESSNVVIEIKPNLNVFELAFSVPEEIEEFFLGTTDSKEVALINEIQKIESGDDLLFSNQEIKDSLISPERILKIDSLLSETKKGAPVITIATNRDGSVSEMFYFTEDRIIREFYRGNVYFEFTNDEGGTERFSYTSDYEELEEKDWFREGRYTIHSDKDLNGDNEVDRDIDTLERRVRQGRVYFYGTGPEGRMLAREDIADMGPGSFRTFLIPEGIDAEGVRPGSANEALSLGAKEVFSGQNAAKENQRTAMINRLIAKNNALITERLNDTKDTQLSRRVRGRIFEGRLWAIATDRLFNASSIVFYDQAPGELGIATWDGEQDRWVDSTVKYTSEENMVDRIEDISDEAGRKVSFHVDLLAFQLERLRWDKVLLQTEIAKAMQELYRLNIEMRKARVSAEMWDVARSHLNDVLLGWGGNARAVLLYKSADDLPSLDERIVRVGGLRKYADTMGTKSTHDDVVVTFGMKALEYWFDQLRMKLYNSRVSEMAAEGGVAILTEKKTGKDHLYIGQDMVKHYNNLRSELQKIAPEETDYNEATNSFNLTQEGIDYRVKLVGGLEGAELEMEKAREAYKKAKEFSDLLREIVNEYKNKTDSL